MTKLIIPPGWKNVTQEHLGEIVIMIPAQTINGKLYPGEVKVIKRAAAADASTGGSDRSSPSK